MGRPRIALLNAAHKAVDTRRNFHRELDAEIETFHAPSGAFPPDFGYDGFVVTGSAASVYWDEPWIGDLKSWVGEAVRAGLPALGVCFGHQLLADVLGGSVRAMGDYEIGYRTVSQDGTNRLLAGAPDDLTVFTTHSDHVTRKPPGATVFAENEYGIHGFRKGRVFGVQFHPEYDRSTAESIAASKDDELSAERLQQVLDGITEENYAAACEAKRLFDNFLEYVEEVRAERLAVD
ncbi:type 1 glutamine amidotransferase [Halohasta salina]|uniref:type 1 glutamine amidotransferase n=1 Tax=Halohasta salina TaxID=2961621 RepID=UPI0020A3D292|nr:type 1 glutamine amidotransferase [Halohasta salina]